MFDSSSDPFLSVETTRTSARQLLWQLKVAPDQMRGIGISMSRLEPASDRAVGGQGATALDRFLLQPRLEKPTQGRREASAEADAAVGGGVSLLGHDNTLRERLDQAQGVAGCGEGEGGGEEEEENFVVIGEQETVEEEEEEEDEEEVVVIGEQERGDSDEEEVRVVEGDEEWRLLARGAGVNPAVLAALPEEMQIQVLSRSRSSPTSKHHGEDKHRPQL